MAHYAKPSSILRKLRLSMPVSLTLEDPLTEQPITIAYENLHSLLVVDTEHLVLEEQVVANLYAEMARFQRAAEYAAAMAEGRYRAWKAARGEELARDMPEKTTKAGKPAAKQGPTVAEVEAFYRAHADYDQMSGAGARMKAVAGLFDDLKWAFRMKSTAMSDQSKIVAGFEGVVRDEDAIEGRLSDYQSLAAEANNIIQASGGGECLADMLAENQLPASPPPPPKKSPRAPKGS